MKNKRPIFTYPPKMQGFSLIEFLVASALSMIVLMAVTSTYFTARNLNTAATSRLSGQQELRNASALIVRDARMAGGFGCFNMANHKPFSVINDSGSAPFNLSSNFSDKSLIPVSENIVTYSGFKRSGNALIFQYGIDDSKPNPGQAVASSCTSIAKADNISDLNTAKSALKITGTEKDGTISTLKHIVVAYAVGSINGQDGLYRFQLNGKSWGDPQLLMKDLTTMQMNYLYVENCPAEVVSASAATSTAQESFILKDALEAGNDATTPALIQIQLGNGKSVHHIEAAVRGGNVCADRSI